MAKEPDVPIIPSRAPWSIAAAIRGMSDYDRIRYFGTSDQKLASILLLAGIMIYGQECLEIKSRVTIGTIRQLIFARFKTRREHGK